MRPKLSNNNTSGTSLIEVMIAIAIMTIVSLGIATLMSNFFKSQAQLNTQQDMFQAASLASGILLNPTVCATAIQDATHGVVVYTGATTNVAFLQQGATPLLAVNTKYSPRLLITSMQLVPTGIPATPVVIPVGSINPPPGTYSQWLVNLVISAAPTSGFVALPDKKMSLTIYTSPLSAPANKISFCSIQSTATEACSALSMNFNAATQTCTLGACATAANVTPGYACTPTCTVPSYYWAFKGGSPASAVCVCGCAAPPPPPIFFY